MPAKNQTADHASAVPSLEDELLALLDEEDTPPFKRETPLSSAPRQLSPLEKELQDLLDEDA